MSSSAAGQAAGRGPGAGGGRGTGERRRLAERFSVSRQIIVGDVALLRAGGTDILATPRGYLLGGRGGGVERTVACVHAPEEMERELNAIVDAGGEVVDVIVEHPVYGQLTGLLGVRSRYDVAEFVRRVEDTAACSRVTGRIHLHTVRCPDEKTFRRVRKSLAENFLLTMCDFDLLKCDGIY